MQLELCEVAVGFHGRAIVDNVSIRLKKGIIGCLLGPSGCGKTTLLRAIAGFEPVLHGEIRIDGKEVSRPGRNSPPEKRQVGMVFQDFALFPNMTVRENVGFGLGALARKERNTRVDRLLQLVALEADASRFPHQLSGGQQQRVALARALAPEPKILLLDEPFSNIDIDLTTQIAAELRDILIQSHTTTIFVTHNQSEAFAIADEIGVINHGRLLQWDSAYNIYYRPRHRFVADFVGLGGFVSGVVGAGGTVETAMGVIPGEIPHGLTSGTTVDVLIRPNELSVEQNGCGNATVKQRTFQGANDKYLLILDTGEALEFLHGSSAAPLREGQRVRLIPAPTRLILFAKPGPETGNYQD